MAAADAAVGVFLFAGAATGQLINTLHTPAMSYHGHKQVRLGVALLSALADTGQL